MNGEKVVGLEGDVRGLFQECRYLLVEGDETFDQDSKRSPPHIQL